MSRVRIFLSPIILSGLTSPSVLTSLSQISAFIMPTVVFLAGKNPSRSIKLPMINGNRSQRLKSWFQLFFLLLLLLVCFQSNFFWQILRVQK